MRYECFSGSALDTQPNNPSIETRFLRAQRRALPECPFYSKGRSYDSLSIRLVAIDNFYVNDGPYGRHDITGTSMGLCRSTDMDLH